MPKLNEKQILARACVHLGVDQTQVLSYRITEEETIRLVVDKGIAGAPLYEIPLAELPEPAPAKSKPRARRRPATVKVPESPAEE